METTATTEALHALIGADLRDSLDEELELELEDGRLDELVGRSTRRGPRPSTGSVYFHELFRLQGELVKLQDWVVHNQAQGRGDLRGPRRRRQGRRDQADHPAAQSARLPRRGPARAQRARAHAMVLPALRRASAGGRRDRAVRPQLVQPRRRRTGDGLLHRGRVRGVLPLGSRVRAHAGSLRHHADQVLVLDHRRASSTCAS